MVTDEDVMCHSCGDDMDYHDEHGCFYEDCTCKVKGDSYEASLLALLDFDDLNYHITIP